MLRSARPLALALAGLTAAAAALALLPQSRAGADVLGSVSVSPTSGTTASALTLSTSGTCTNPAATAVQARIAGAGFTDPGQSVTGVTPITALTTTPGGGYSFPLSETLRDYGNVAVPPVVFTGQYTFTVKCRSNVGLASLGDFTGTINFSSPTEYAAAGASPSPSASSTTSPSPKPTASASATPTATITPTPSPTTVPYATGTTLMALDSTGSPLGRNPALARGQKITLKITGFRPQEVVSATVYSVPRTLTSTRASSSGLVTYPFTVPKDLPAGSHTLQLRGTSSISAFAFTVRSPLTSRGTTSTVSAPVVARAPSSAGAVRGGTRLARTGSSVTSMLLLGLLLLWAGAMVLVSVGPPRRLARPVPSSGPRGRHARVRR